MSILAVSVSSLSKKYRLYKEKNDSLKATVTKFRRAKFQEFLVLNNINLEVNTGTTLGIIGSNGSGKSTLLKTLAQIIQPDSGNVVVNGRLVALLELGAGFHPELTGRENIYLNAAILGMRHREIDQAIDRIIDFSELEEFIDVAIKHYSSGMVVRLGFAVAVHVDPDVLIIDEVLSVGDESFQQKSFNKIQEFKNQGKTIIIVSHALGTIAQICDQVLWIENGSVTAIGPPEVVIDRYLQAQQSETNGTIDVIRPRIGDVLKHVAITDGRENDSGIFKSGSSLSFSMVSSTNFECDEVYFVICIRDSTGRIVWQNHESACVVEKRRQNSNEIVITSDIPVFAIREGIFEVIFRVFNAQNHKLIDEWNRDVKFNIQRDANPDYGFLNVIAQWSH